MNTDNIEALMRLRNDILNKKVAEIMDTLLKYYPPKAKLIVTKDYWKIETE